MAVVSGQDFAFGSKMRWIFESGVGKAFLIVTRKSLYIFPYHTFHESVTKRVKTDMTIGGRHPLEALRDLLAAPDTVPETLDAILARWCGEIRGPIVKPLDTFKRVKIRGGFFRMVALSQKEKGFDSGLGSAVGFRPTKEELAEFTRFFEGDPRRV